MGFSYPGINNQIMTGSPDYGARILINGDPGKGCSSDYTRQFNTSAFKGPGVNSTGLESGQNYMRSCPDHVWDFAIARNIRFGGGRQLQLRLEMFNAFSEVVLTGRNTTAQFVSLQDPNTITNLPYNADGTPRPELCARAARDSAWRPARVTCERSRRRSDSHFRRDTEKS